ncbi:MAG: MFS transporter [Bacteroidetes bacterium]|nr:MFS transporter [Bacteroidota bacterium]
MKPFNTQKNYILLLSAMLCFAIATALFQGVQENYLAESLNVSRSGRGIVEFFREMPGLLLFLILALFYKMPEHRILRIGFFVAITGIGGFVLVGTKLIPAVFFLTIFSAGQHILMPVRQSYAVHSVEPGKEGSALGLMRSIQSIGRVAGFFIVPVIFLMTAKTENGFIITFICVIFFAVGALVISFFLRNEGGHVRRQRLYFRKKYKTYYILQNFYGARKQVILTFGPYVLILKYGATPAIIATLMGACAVVSIVTSPLIGKLIDRIGYKKVLVGDTVILFFVCLVYGFAHHLFPEHIAFIVICGVFILDSLVSHASMAASVYVKELSDDREEMTATLTTGISLDHVISILIALAGGFIWEHIGIELLFVLAAVMAMMNSLIALTIKSGKRQNGNMMEEKTT